MAPTSLSERTFTRSLCSRSKGSLSRSFERRRECLGPKRNSGSFGRRKKFCESSSSGASRRCEAFTAGPIQSSALNGERKKTCESSSNGALRHCAAFTGLLTFWSGRRGSNSLPPPWQGGALPDELRPHMVPPKERHTIWCLRSESLFCGKATAVETCPRHVSKSRLSIPTDAHILVPPVGIEPTARGFSVRCSTN